MFSRRHALMLTSGAALSAAAIRPAAAFSPPADTIPLWPQGAPDGPIAPITENLVARSADAGPNRAINGISNPRLVRFRPRSPNGAAILVIPGGGYQRIVVDHEGFETARWFNDRGFTAYVLFYRLPAEGWRSGPNTSFIDAQRAMRLIRSRAGTDGIDPERIAVLGFSAGGHLAADLAARFATSVRPAVDQVDQLSARPDLAACLYPVIAMEGPHIHKGSRNNLVGANASPELARAHTPSANVPGNAPPHFLAHSEDDGAVPAENSLMLRAALKAAKIPVETHLFASGGHGYGLARGRPEGAWPDLLLAFAAQHGFPHASAAS